MTLIVYMKIELKIISKNHFCPIKSCYLAHLLYSHSKTLFSWTKNLSSVTICHLCQQICIWKICLCWQTNLGFHKKHVMPDNTMWVGGVRWERLRVVSIISANFAPSRATPVVKSLSSLGGALLFGGRKPWPALPADKQHFWRRAVWSLFDILKTVMAFMISAALRAHCLFCSNGRWSEGEQNPSKFIWFLRNSKTFLHRVLATIPVRTVRTQN